MAIRLLRQPTLRYDMRPRRRPQTMRNGAMVLSAVLSLTLAWWIFHAITGRL